MIDLIKEVPAIVWTVIGTIVGSYLTFRGTKSTNRASLDTKYLDKMESVFSLTEQKLQEFKLENEEMKQKFNELTNEVNRLREEMKAKDKLIERLEDDNRKLEIDKLTYKRLLSEANDELNKLKGYG